MSMTQEQAREFLIAEAKKAGKTFDRWLEEDIRPILEKAWEIQQRTGEPVPIDALVKELNEGRGS